MKRARYQVFIVLLFCFLFFAAGGCGYTTRSMISGRFRTIYITPFVNKIDFTQETALANKYKVNRPLLESEITKAVIDKYVFDGNLRPQDKESADLVLRGELIEFRRDPLRYTESDEVEEYRINIVVNISLWDTRENKVIWEEKGFTGDASYFTSFAAINPSGKTEEAAITDAVKDLSRRIVERTVEEW